MSRRELVSITLVLVLALVLAAADVFFILPLLRHGELPLFSVMEADEPQPTEVPAAVPSPEETEEQPRETAEEQAARYADAQCLSARASAAVGV